MTEHKTFKAIAKETESLRYVIYYPDGYSESDKPWPLVVFMHGAGQRGDSHEQIYDIGLPKRIKNGDQFPFVMVAPQCPKDHYWGYNLETLNCFLDSVLETLNVDINRVYLTGNSMGGTATWFWAINNPNRFAAIAPVCGQVVPWIIKYTLVHIPCWAFHGTEDKTVSFESSRYMVEEINKNGGNAKLTAYEGLDHNAWDYAYYDEELYHWLLSHSLKK